MAMADQSRMSNLQRLFPVVLLLLAGCLELEQTVTLAADGSGRQTFDMTVRESTLAELGKAGAAAQLGADASPFAVFDRKLVESELTAAGFELAAYEAKKVPGKRSVALAATFSKFAALQQSPLGGSACEWVLAKGPREGTAKLTLYPQGKAAWMEARTKAEELQVGQDAVAMEFFRKRQQQLAGLAIKVRLQVPGEVLVWTRNMERTGEREVTATITAAQIQTPEDLIRRLAPRFEVIFVSKDCNLPLQ
jgi:hypothetical protein